jgi:hypothetical protein
VGKDLIPRSVELTPRMPLKTISVRLAKPVRMRVAIFRETRSHDLKKKHMQFAGTTICTHDYRTQLW